MSVPMEPPMRLTLVSIALMLGWQPGLPPPSAPVPVDQHAKAPFASTWNNVIEFFGDSRGSIETIDKPSGSSSAGP